MSLLFRSADGAARIRQCRAPPSIFFGTSGLQTVPVVILEFSFFLLAACFAGLSLPLRTPEANGAATAAFVINGCSGHRRYNHRYDHR